MRDGIWSQRNTCDTCAICLHSSANLIHLVGCFMWFLSTTWRRSYNQTCFFKHSSLFSQNKPASQKLLSSKNHQRLSCSSFEFFRLWSHDQLRLGCRRRIHPQRRRQGRSVEMWQFTTALPLEWRNGVHLSHEMDKLYLDFGNPTVWTTL